MNQDGKVVKILLVLKEQLMLTCIVLTIFTVVLTVAVMKCKQKVQIKQLLLNNFHQVYTEHQITDYNVSRG